MGVIIDGVFYPGKKPKVVEGNQGHKSWDHQRQREEHGKDLLQRFVGGKPSGAFIRAYPEEAKEQFTPQEIQQYGNDYN